VTSPRQPIGLRLVIKVMRYVPNVRLNLISVGKLDDAILLNSFSGEKWKLTNSCLRSKRRLFIGHATKVMKQKLMLFMTIQTWSYDTRGVGM